MLTETIPSSVLIKDYDSSGLIGRQVSHSETLLKSILKRNYALDLSVMGTGKTYTGSSIARFFSKIGGCPVLVVCPKISKSNWKRVLDEYGVTNYEITNYEKIIRGTTKYCKPSEFAQDPRYKENKNEATAVYLLRWTISENTFIIFDESHKCKAPASSTSELLLAAWQQNFKFLMLSATQVTSPTDMFILGRILNYHKFLDYNEWLKEFEDPTNTYFRIKIDMNLPHAKKKMEEIHSDLFSRGIASRMTVEDFPERFKNNEIVPEAFDMGEFGDEIAEVYREMREEIKRLEERGYSDCILAEIMKARRKAELLKVNSFIELASDAYENGRSVCIFVNFIDTLNAIVARLNKKFGGKLVSKICGGQKSDERDVEIAKFQSDVSRFMVANIQAGGVSVSLHDLNGNYPRVSYLSPSYSAVSFVQATGRIHRNGGMTDCLQYVVFCKDTIEENVCYRLKGKVKCLNLLNDGDLDITEYGLEYDFSNEDYEKMLKPEEVSA